MIGLLLLGLDGIGAWRLNLGGVSDRVAGPTYAALVLAVVSAVALAYGLVVRLSGPRIFALLLAQPVLPLLTPGLPPEVAPALTVVPPVTEAPAVA